MTATMTATYEKALGNFAGDNDDTRIQLVQIAEPGELPTLELRMQRYGGESLGWVTHRRMTFAPGQIADIQDAINLMDQDARTTTLDQERERRKRQLQVVSDSKQQSSG